MVKADEVYEAIKATGKPVGMARVHDVGGMFATIEKCGRILVDLVAEVSAIQRETFGLDKLVFGTKCGSSDTTSGLSSNLIVGEVCRMMTENGGRFIQGSLRYHGRRIHTQEA